MSTASEDFQLRRIQHEIAQEIKRKKDETTEFAIHFDPHSKAAANYEGYWYALAEADRIVAEIFNRYARDGRVVR